MRIHKVDPDPDFCDVTQKMIDRAMALHRKMGLSVTPKAHGMEHHAVPQMRRVQGGIGKLMENWVEHYHQVGYRYDVSFCRAGSLQNQAGIRSRMESRACHPHVRMAKKLVDERYKNSRRKRKSSLIKKNTEKNGLLRKVRPHLLAKPKIFLTSYIITQVKTSYALATDQNWELGG